MIGLAVDLPLPSHLDNVECAVSRAAAKTEMVVMRQQLPSTNKPRFKAFGIKLRFSVDI